MGPQPASSQQAGRQGAACRGCAWKSRLRDCLLKGCGHSFFPSSWAQRYCSSSCREAADLWRCRKTAREYRRSEEGKAKRAAQSKRRRRRQREERCREGSPGSDSVAEATRSTPAESPRSPLSESDCGAEATRFGASEGHHPFLGEGNFCCDRPGCYLLFDRSPRSPLQRFCSLSCYQAMRRVKVREARWRSRDFLRRCVGCSGGHQTPQRRCRL